MHPKTAYSSILSAAVLLAATATGQADHKVKVHRDLDGDGHYNRKTYEPHHHYHYGYYNRPYWGGWGWYRPWHRGYHYYPRTSVSLYGSPGNSRYSYSDNLAAQVQQALRSRGYYGGPIDGDIGAGSRAAIRAYQRDRGLSVSGRVDTTLLRSLRIG